MEFAGDVATSQAVWAILCIGLAVVVLRALRTDSIKREDKLIGLFDEFREESKAREAALVADSKQRETALMLHLERSNDALQRTADAIENVNVNIQSITSEVTGIHDRIDHIEKKINKGSE